jgi:exodeoxyribonuclease VII large subunit
MRRRLRDDERRLDALEHRLSRTHPGIALALRQQRLQSLIHRLQRAQPGVALGARRQQLEASSQRLERALRRRITELCARARLVERGLSALSPLATLQRGYAIVCRADDGALVTGSDQLETGSAIDIRLAEGGLEAIVDRIKPSKPS